MARVHWKRNPEYTGNGETTQGEAPKRQPDVLPDELLGTLSSLYPEISGEMALHNLAYTVHALSFLQDESRCTWLVESNNGPDDPLPWQRRILSMLGRLVDEEQIVSAASRICAVKPSAKEVARLLEEWYSLDMGGAFDSPAPNVSLHAALTSTLPHPTPSGKAIELTGQAPEAEPDETHENPTASAAEMTPRESQQEQAMESASGNGHRSNANSPSSFHKPDHATAEEQDAATLDLVERLLQAKKQVIAEYVLRHDVPASRLRYAMREAAIRLLRECQELEHSD